LTDDDSLGPCCLCETTTAVHRIILLDVKCQVPGHGWGCFVRGLPPDGASAVLCDHCVERWQQGTALRFACRGYPGQDGRVPIIELTEPHEHDLKGHPELGTLH